MATTTAQPVSFADADSRYDDMHSTIEAWIEDLSDLVDGAQASDDFDVEDLDERAKREVEAEAVASVVGRYFGLDTSNSAFYLAAWQGEETVAIRDRLGRIRTVSEEFIETLER